MKLTELSVVIMGSLRLDLTASVYLVVIKRNKRNCMDL